MNELQQEFVQALKDSGIAQLVAFLIVAGLMRLGWKVLHKIDLL